MEKFSTARIISKTRGDVANINQREGETLLSYLERFKKTYDDIEGISQNMVITCFKGGFQSKMLYTELQLKKSETISEMFNVARKVALTEWSAQESQYKKNEKYVEASP